MGKEVLDLIQQLSEWNLKGEREFQPREEFLGPPDWPEPNFLCNGYEVHWTGWKACQNNNQIVGQWIGWPLDPKLPYLHVCLPNMKGGPYQKGYVFDVACDVEQINLTLSSEGRKQLLFDGCQKMLEMIVELTDKGD